MPRPLSRTVHGAVGIERDDHLRGVAGERLVDRVVDDLVDHVMQARAVIGVADVHARALAHRVEALEDLDADLRRSRIDAAGGSGEPLRPCSKPCIDQDARNNENRATWCGTKYGCPYRAKLKGCKILKYKEIFRRLF